MRRSRRMSLLRDIMNDGARRLSTQLSRHWLALDHRLVRDQELRKSLRRIQKERKKWRRKGGKKFPQENPAEEPIEEEEEEEEEEEARQTILKSGSDSDSDVTSLMPSPRVRWRDEKRKSPSKSRYKMDSTLDNRLNENLDSRRRGRSHLGPTDHIDDGNVDEEDRGQVSEEGATFEDDGHSLSGRLRRQSSKRDSTKSKRSVAASDDNEEASEAQATSTLTRKRSPSKRRSLKRKRGKKEELRRSAFLEEQEIIRKLLLEETRAQRSTASARVADNTSQNLSNAAITVDGEDDDEGDVSGKDGSDGALERSSSSRRRGRRGRPGLSGSAAASHTVASPKSTPKTRRTFRRSRTTPREASAELGPHRPDSKEDLPSSAAATRGGVVEISTDADEMALLHDPTRKSGKTTLRQVEENVNDDGNNTNDDDDDPLSKPIDTSNVRVPVWVTLLIMTGYILGGAFMFTMWEQGWDFLVGSYFCFITLSTIGFGDFVPGTNSLDSWAAQEKWVICCVYLLLGMAMQAMCFHLMQEEVRAKFRRLAARVGLVPPVDPVVAVRVEAAGAVDTDSEEDEEEELVK